MRVKSLFFAGIFGVMFALMFLLIPQNSSQYSSGVLQEGCYSVDNQLLLADGEEADSDMGERIESTFSDMGDQVGSWWDKVKEWFSDRWEDLKNSVEDLPDWAYYVAGGVGILLVLFILWMIFGSSKK